MSLSFRSSCASEIPRWCIGGAGLIDVVSPDAEQDHVLTLCDAVVQGLYVHPDYQGRGIGTRLWQA